MKTLHFYLCGLFFTILPLSQPGAATLERSFFVNRHLICSAVLSEASNTRSIDVRKKHILGVFQNLPQDLSLEVIAQDSKDQTVLIDGLRKPTNLELQSLVARLHSLNVNAQSHQNLATFQVSGAANIIEFVDAISSAYSQIHEQTRTHPVSKLIRSRRQLGLAMAAITNVMVAAFDQSWLSTIFTGPLVLAGGFPGNLIYYVQSYERKLRKNLISQKEFVSTEGSGFQEFSYLGFSAYLPESIARALLAEGSLDDMQLADTAIFMNSSMGALSRLTRLDMSPTIFKSLNPKFVGIDIYIDRRNPSAPELYGLIRLLPERPQSTIQNSLLDPANRRAPFLPKSTPTN